MAGAIVPGERLIERDIVETYDVGRGTVRAALQRLEHDGLVTVATHRGAFVRELDADALRGLFEVRTALELEAAHRMLERHGGRVSESMERAVQGLEAACARKRMERAVQGLEAACARKRVDWGRISDAHSGVHESIVHAADSPRIEAAYRQLTQELTLFLLALRPVWSAEEMAAHHRQLVAGLEREGVPALRRHLEDGEAAVIAGLPGAQ
jgi:DNA-binding GntR family transcriptional regulator